jgi:Cation efflux family
MQIYKLPDVEHATKRVMFKLLLVSVVCTILMIAEVVGGVLAGSLAIMTDAAHLFSDLSGIFCFFFTKIIVCDVIYKHFFFIFFFKVFSFQSFLCGSLSVPPLRN